MARPKSPYPTPGKRQRGRMWQIFWQAGGVFYGLSAGQVSTEDAELRRMEIALALRGKPWPAWATGAPAAQRYLAAQQPTVAESDLLAVYEASLRSEVGRNWATTCMGHLRELLSRGKTLVDVRAGDAQAFLDGITRTPGPFRMGNGVRSVSTRNRALSACGRFYAWAVRTGRVASNPFEGIAKVRESDVDRIIYLSRDERDVVLAAAEGDRKGAAIWLALYAGLRRGEVARCQWRDVGFDAGRLDVPPGKTGRRREVPLAEPLAAFLSARQPKHRRGRIVPWPAEQTKWEYRADALLARLEAACPEAPAGHMRWNVFRHTFGSLLAQAGVSLDKISAWMGNSPTICRRHYAQFVPKDRRDEEIDLL